MEQKIKNPCQSAAAAFSIIFREEQIFFRQQFTAVRRPLAKLHLTKLIFLTPPKDWFQIITVHSNFQPAKSNITCISVGVFAFNSHPKDFARIIIEMYAPPHIRHDALVDATRRRKNQGKN